MTKISSLRKNDLLLRLKEHFEAKGIEQKPVQKQPVRKAASRPAAKPAEKTKTEKRRRNTRRETGAEGTHKAGQRDRGQGYLEVLPDGFGFIRFDNYESSAKDVYVSNTQIRRFRLQTGDEIVGDARKASVGDERYAPLMYRSQGQRRPPEASIHRKPFDSLTPIYPTKRLHLETNPTGFSMRLIDLIAPIGYGQRGLIVAPPKAERQRF